MSRISGKETKPEIVVRQYLHANGFRFRKNDTRFLGNPDVVLPKYHTIVFVNGCFWHGHNCKSGKLPETRKEFWENKITNTIERDRKNIKELVSLGWKVIIVWQCELKNQDVRLKRLEKLMYQIKL